MHWFASLFGAEAGNLALKAMAVEGVYLSGGIVRRNAELLTSTDNFILAFNAKGRMAHLLRDMPVYLVLDQNLAMRGLANYALKIMKNRNST
jgi:glucokinase